MPARREKTDSSTAGSARFPLDMLYRGASLYYDSDHTQAEIGEALGISRATVSRLLSEARACGIVHIEVRDPAASQMRSLEDGLCARLDLRRATVTPPLLGADLGPALAPAVTQALSAAKLLPGDALLVGSGATMWELAQQPLASLPGVIVAPVVGGQDEAEHSYQTNEITRQLAVRAGATPALLYAPAAPAPGLFQSLRDDPATKRVTDLWVSAKCALLGVGPPPRTRASLPAVLLEAGVELMDAVGDISSRPFDAAGRPVDFPGADRMIAIRLSALRRIPYSIAVAVGQNKAAGIAAAARARYFNWLITDADTARAVLALEDLA